MSYGKEGTIYQIGTDDQFAVNDKFVIATLLATIIILMDLINGEESSNVIESLASAIYDNLKEIGHTAAEGTVADAGDTAD